MSNEADCAGKHSKFGLMAMKEKKEGMIFVISAPSGAGKSTLAKRLIRACPSLRPSVSYTTRTPRKGEKNGTDYFFIGPEDFRAKIKEGFFAEWAEVYGDYYGTSFEFLDGAVKKGNILLEIDTQGAFQIKEKYTDRAVLVFVSPPSLEELRRRLTMRATESGAVLRRRLAAARKEMEEGSRYDHFVINDSLEKATNQLKTIVSSYK